MPKSKIITQLAKQFQLSEENPLFKSAIYPKSCGGGEEFKFLALYGDAILNLLLLENISRNRTMNSGHITVALHSFHNDDTLYHIAKNLRIQEVMKALYKTTSMTRNDLKESVEALLGATYQKNGFESCKKIVTNLVQLAIEKNFLNPNPKGILQVLFQKKNFTIPKYESTRVGGPDHQQLFQCTVTGKYEGKNYKHISGIFTSKKEAEKDAAKKFVTELGELKLLENSFFRV